MHEYEIDPDAIIDHWFRILALLSIDVFDRYLDLFEFPIPITSELTAIAKEFTLVAASYLADSSVDSEFSKNKYTPPEPPPKLDLPPKSETTDTFVDLWHYTMNRLAESGYADEVYDWVQKFVANREKYWSFYAHIAWFELLMYWAHPRPNTVFAPLALTETKISAMQLILLRHAVDVYRLRDRIISMEYTWKIDKWTHFVLHNIGVGIWLGNKTHDYHMLMSLREIIALLSEDEILVVNAWGDENTTSEYDRRNFRSIFDLKTDLAL